MRMKTIAHLRLAVGDNPESTSLLLCLLLVLLCVPLLSVVQVLDGLSASGLVRLLGLIGSVSDLGDLRVGLLEGVAEGRRDSGLDGLLDDAGSGSLEELVQDVVCRVVSMSSVEGKRRRKRQH